MSRTQTKRRIVSNAPTAAIVLNKSPQHQGRDRSGFLLTLFMRIVALFWLVQGLSYWGLVLDSDADGRSELMTLSTQAVVAVVFFAVIDLVASVGLWLATPWGGVIWLVTVGAQLFTVAAMPGFHRHPLVTTAADVGFVAAYLILAWRAAVAQDRQWHGI